MYNLAGTKSFSNTMRTRFNKTAFFLCCIFFNSLAFGQDSIVARSVFDYLTQEEGAKILLELDLDSLMDNRKNAQYIPATLTDELGKSFKLEIRTRGKFRRKRCEIPPIKLKFHKDSLQEDQFNAMNEIKLVLPCADRPENDQLIVREYVAYRMYEGLNPDFSTRARLIRLHLKDHKKKRPKKMFGLLVEHEEQVSARTNCSIVQEWGVTPDKLNADHTALMVLHQYFIGNTDWEILSCRNIMLLQPPDSAKLIPVPYDFDFSGLVSAPYASPSAESGVLTVRDRYLMANGIDEQAIRNARDKFLAAKKSLYAWCKNSNLSSESSELMTAFLDIFFKAVEADEPVPVKLNFTKE